MNIASTKTAPSGSTGATIADVTVVGGAGHVGIPLVLAFAEAGLTVNVNDLNETALATLRSGKLPFIEHGAAPLLARALAGNKLLFTSSPDAIGRTGPVIITIGTPVDAAHCGRSTSDSSVDRLSEDDRLAIRLSQTVRPQEQRCVLSRARGAKNYPRAKSFPGPGFSAGPCLFKDTMQLAAYARNHFGLGHAAMQVNEGLVLQLVDDLRRAYEISTMTVGLLGMAFKAEIDDTRASLSYKLKHALEIYARKVLTTDPFVTTDPNILPLEQVIARSDILILCTPHSVYAEADLEGKPVVDVWGFLKNANVAY